MADTLDRRELAVAAALGVWAAWFVGFVLSVTPFVGAIVLPVVAALPALPSARSVRVSVIATAVAMLSPLVLLATEARAGGIAILALALVACVSFGWMLKSWALRTAASWTAFLAAALSCYPVWRAFGQIDPALEWPALLVMFGLPLVLLILWLPRPVDPADGPPPGTAVLRWLARAAAVFAGLAVAALLREGHALVRTLLNVNSGRVTGVLLGSAALGVLLGATLQRKLRRRASPLSIGLTGCVLAVMSAIAFGAWMDYVHTGGRADGTLAIRDFWGLSLRRLLATDLLIAFTAFGVPALFTGMAIAPVAQLATSRREMPLLVALMLAATNAGFVALIGTNALSAARVFGPDMWALVGSLVLLTVALALGSHQAALIPDAEESNMRPGSTIALLLLALPVVTALSVGCGAVPVDAQGVNLGRGVYGSSGASVGQLAETKDIFLEFQAKKKTTSGLAFVQMSRDLWQPFRWEATGGLFDPAHANAVGAILCTELDGRGTSFGTFYGMCAQVQANGLLAYAYTDDSPTPIGQVEFNGATSLDFAIETDATTMTFLARETGTLVYSTVASTPFTGQTIPLLPATGVSGIGNQAVIGFENFRVVSNGTPGVAPTAQQAAADTIWTAADGMLEAMYLLEGAAPDFDGATPLLTQAQTDLATAVAAVEALPAGKARKKALKDLGKAGKKLQATLDHVNADEAVPALDDVMVALQRAIKAIVKLYPVS